MKKATFKITRGLKGFLSIAAIVGALMLPGNAASKMAVFAPIGLVQGMKKKGITLDAEEEKLINGMEAELNAGIEKALKDAAEGLLTKEQAKEQIDAVVKDLSLTAKAITVPGTGENGGADKSLADFLRERSEEITAIKEAQKGGGAAKNPLDAQRDAIKELLTGVKEQKTQAGNTPFSVSVDKNFDRNDKPSEANKAAVNMTSSNTQANASGATVPANYMYGVEGNPNPDPRINPYITQYIDNGSTDLAALPYADKLPTEGTMAITSEGALKPLLSVSIERRFSTAFKIAGRAKVTEEALDDIPGMQALINNELRYSHDIAEQNAVYAHVAAFAPGFVAGSLAATTDNATNYDAIRAAIYAVKIASKGRFIPNAVVVNSADKYAMGATKDSTNQYVMPPFIMPDGTTIEGVRVIETVDPTNVPAGTFIVGDWRKIKRRSYKPFNIRIGQGIVGSATAANIMSDFEANMYTVIGESRLHLWHYKNDETAFIKSTFSAVKTAIETP